MKQYTIIGRRQVLLGGLALLGIVGVLAGALSLVPNLVTQTDASVRKLPVYCTDRGGKTVSLTFDAAWGNEDTQMLIDTFAKYGISATFFVVGEWADRCAESVKALHEAGHEVMNHSDTHAHMPQLSREQMVQEINGCNDKIKALTGECPTLFRAPYGDYDNALIEVLAEQNMQCVQWDVDSLDWKDLSADEITQRVLSKVKSGSIVLFHNAAKHTPEALPAIIEGLKAEGYTFLKASEMLYSADCPINHEGRQLGASTDTTATKTNTAKPTTKATVCSTTKKR